MTTIRRKFKSFVKEQMADLAELNSSRFRDRASINQDLRTYHALQQVLDCLKQGENPLNLILQKSEQDSERYKVWLKMFEQDNDTLVPMPDQTWNNIAFMVMLFLKAEEENVQKNAA